MLLKTGSFPPVFLAQRLSPEPFNTPIRLLYLPSCGQKFSAQIVSDVHFQTAQIARSYLRNHCRIQSNLYTLKQYKQVPKGAGIKSESQLVVGPGPQPRPSLSTCFCYQKLTVNMRICDNRMTNPPGLPEPEGVPKMWTSSFKTRTVPGRPGQAGHPM